MRLLPALALLPLLLAPAAAADSPGIAGILAPEISPDGSQIAFSYQGDIWVVPSSGGRAHRLTDNPAFDTNPVWNDAGTEIAFSSNRRGNHDIYRMRLTGGQPDRITFAPHDDLVTDWQGDTLLFSSRREPYSGELYAIGIPASGDGSAMERRVTVDMSRYSYGRFSPSGQGIAAARGNIGWTRKEYRGSADHDLVVLDRDGSDIRIAAGSETMEGDTFDSFPAWGAGETLYFISDRDGWGKNLYRLTEGGPRKLTDYSKDQDGAVFLSADRDGSTLCFAVQGKLHLLESAGGTPRPVPVTIDAEMKRTTLERTALAGGVTEFAVSPDGKYVAAVVRGDILIVPVIDPEEPPPPDSPRYGESWNVTDSVWRDFEVDWHPDGDRIAYVCDEDGDFEVFIRDLNTRGTTQITRDEVGELAPKFSPDGKKLAYIRGNRELVVADADGKHAKVVATTGLVWGGIFRQDYRWSPDSRWIAYEDQDPSFTNELMVVPADGSTPPRNATRHFANDFTPRWSADGKYLYFASDRGNL
ncbi:MAG TPA: DPP IV N-terminal domain-containing protein, partial [bacterium]|nr:DPP IV N-terminal domain-containing protein [bacterium]